MAARRQHPEAKAADLALAAREREPVVTGWRCRYGWRIRLWLRDGTFRQRLLAATIDYAEARAEYVRSLAASDVEGGDLTRLEAHHVHAGCAAA